MIQKDEKGKHLAKDRSEGSPANSHFPNINKERIQKHIEDATGTDANHGIKGISLKTKHVVHA